MKKRRVLSLFSLVCAVIMLASCGEGKADTVFTYADTIAWDGQYDVVVIGFGGAGSVAAKYAEDGGAKVLVAEKAPEGHEGGNSRVCGQFFNSTEDYESLLKYYQAKAGDTTTVSDTMLKTYVRGMSNIVDQLVNDFGADRGKIYSWYETGVPMMMTEYPEFEGSDSVRIRSISQKDVGNGGLYRLLSKAARTEDNIDVWFDSPAVGLIQDPDTKTILGTVIERDGKKLNIRARNGVVMALGGFENNPEMIQNYLGLTSYAFNGGAYNTGDGINMAIEAGAKLWHMEVYEGSMGPFGNICFEGIRGWSPSNDFATGSLIYVGENGQRFLREDERSRHGHVSLGGVWVTPKRPERAFLVFDKAKYDELMSLKTLASRANVDPAIIDEKAIVGSTLEELCGKTNISYDGLSREIANYNNFARTGVDLKLGRDAKNMAAFNTSGPYYAIRVVPNILNTQGGPQRNENAEILDTKGNPIPHLYSAGEFGGITSNMYTAGGNMAECIIFGKLAGTNAAAEKAPLPAYTQRTKIESEMVYVPGYETDISEQTYETGDNEYIGIGQGIGGDLVLKVTVEKGAVTGLEILKQNETEGIGSKAIEQLPAQFVGMDSVESVNAVDTVSGATVTSNALKNAVSSALQEAAK